MVTRAGACDYFVTRLIRVTLPRAAFCRHTRGIILVGKSELRWPWLAGLARYTHRLATAAMCDTQAGRPREDVAREKTHGS